jgi:hypothetical protein
MRIEHPFDTIGGDRPAADRLPNRHAEQGRPEQRTTPMQHRHTGSVPISRPSPARHATPDPRMSGASSRALVSRARALLIEASGAQDPAQRFVLGHLAALRTAAAVLAAEPGAAPRRPTSAWILLTDAQPSFADRAAQFAAGAQLRALVEAGVQDAVTRSRADAELAAAVAFLAEAEEFLGMSPVLLAG